MKIKIKEVATELGKSSKEILEACKELGIVAKSANSSITPEDAMKISEFIKNPVKKEEKKEVKKEEKKETKPSTPSIRKRGIRIVRKAKTPPTQKE